MRFYLGLLCLTFIILSGCDENPTTKQEPDYDQTKKMVIDIMQTDEGKKVLREMLQDDQIKQQMIIDADEMKTSITDALHSDQNTEMWTKLFDDATFANTFIDATKDGQEKMFKHLMNDAAFQKKMLELLQNPEISKQTLTILKSQQFREHLEETIQETLESPVFQEKMKQTLLKAAGKQREDAEDENDNDEGEDVEDDNEDDNDEDEGDEDEDKNAFQ